MLLYRFLSAVVAIPVLVLLFLKGGSSLNFYFFLMLTVLGTVEYFQMAIPNDPGLRNVGIVSATIVYLGSGLVELYGLPVEVATASMFLAFSLPAFWLLFHPDPIPTVGQRFGLTVLGILYVPVLFLFFPRLVGLNAADDGSLLLALFAIVWANDTGAYFSGKLLGRHKFYERISPKKTWEGSIGGALFGLVCLYLFNGWLSLNWSIPQMVVAGIAVGYVGQLGDLIESMLKRSFGIKDSGSLIPGHGGVLDRFDALLFGAPVLYYFAVIFVY